MLSRTILATAILLFTLPPAIPAVQTPYESFGAFLYTAASCYEPLAWLHGEERFPAGSLLFINNPQGRHPLVPDFAASADPAVSFDGQRVLFAGKIHANDPWQIWEVDLTGGAKRRITSFPEDCIRPFYLPDDRIVYARKLAGVFQIETKELASNKTGRLTYFPASSVPTDVLRDGRILFQSAYPPGSGENPEIYTVYSDGSGVESYRCDHGRSRHSAAQLTSGDVVFASSHGLARFTSARAQEVKILSPSGDYAGIAESAGGEWIVSWRADSKAHYRLMRWSPGTEQMKELVPEPDANLVEPVLIAPHLVPNRHPSGLHDWANANLLCLNAYTSKHPVADGSIQSVRVYSHDDNGHSKLLGTAPVERDGSFYVQVPSEQPLQFELLDASGKSLQREAGYFWLRRGEQRVCVGCHAGPETAPENKVPQILLKSTIPADMTGTSAQSAGGH